VERGRHDGFLGSAIVELSPGFFGLDYTSLVLAPGPKARARRLWEIKEEGVQTKKRAVKFHPSRRVLPGIQSSKAQFLDSL
jgi:hypothetical protein